jgi:hypothetical protein
MFRKFLIIGLCLNFIGCAYLFDRQNKPFIEPQYGMSKQQLMAMLGRPEGIEIYKKTDLTRVEYYFYIKKYPTYQEKVPVCLIDQKVVGWGKTFYEDHVSQDDIRIK